MPFRAEPLSLNEDEQQELQRMSLSRLLPAGDVFRARVILMLAEGRSYAEVQKRLNTTAPTISKWRKRFPATAHGWLAAGTPSWSEAECDHTATAGQGFGGNPSQA